MSPSTSGPMYVGAGPQSIRDKAGEQGSGLESQDWNKTLGKWEFQLPEPCTPPSTVYQVSLIIRKVPITVVVLCLKFNPKNGRNDNAR